MNERMMIRLVWSYRLEIPALGLDSFYLQVGNFDFKDCCANPVAFGNKRKSDFLHFSKF